MYKGNAKKRFSVSREFRLVENVKKYIMLSYNKERISKAGDCKIRLKSDAKDQSIGDDF